MIDLGVRERIRNDLDATFVIEAAAGTGKTTELVHRIVAVVERGRARLGEVIAVTFTEKAAGELRLRLRAGLEERVRATPDNRSRLQQAIAELEVAHIGTIHSLCSDLLKERPIEAGVDPQFELLAEGQMERLYARVFDAWFGKVLADPPEGVRRILRVKHRDGPRQLLFDAGLALVQHRDHPAPWRRDPWDRDASMQRVLAELRLVAMLAGAADDPSDWLAKALESLAMVLADLDRTKDPDRIEGTLRNLAREGFWRWNGFRTKTFSSKLGLLRADVQASRDRARTIVEAFALASQHDVAALLHTELQGVVRAYEQWKDELGALDFVDLLLDTRNLLRRSASVRKELQDRIRYVFVDEFQDTDPLQAEILLLLAARDPAETDWRKVVPVPGKLFVVGDPKQSIYRFRRADVRLYEEVKSQLAANGAEVLPLQTSFRARPGIQALVNTAFAPVMQGAADGSQATYVPLAAHRGEHDAVPSVVALPIPGVDGSFGQFADIEEMFPRLVAAWTRWVLEKSGWTVQEDGVPVPVASRHVCFLFRRFNSQWKDVTGPYVAALEERDIPHVLVGGSAYHLREEVDALRTVLVAIEWPDDELHVYGALKGPLFGHSDESLFLFRSKHGSLHPLETYDDSDVAQTLALLGEIHLKRNGRPIARTITALLEATRAHAGFADWPSGEQTLANVLKLVEIAGAFEAEGATSFRLFIESLLEHAENPAAPNAAIVEEGTDGVRIMTVHKAKGLEFPIVVLCDPTYGLDRSDRVGRLSHFADSESGRWLEALAECRPVELHEMESTVQEHEKRENVRVLYVAATRAKDVLVLPTAFVGHTFRDRWHGLLDDAIGPTDHGEEPLGPGVHRAGGIDVTWWDPGTLDLLPGERAGLREIDFLKKVDGADDGRAAYETWKATARELRATAATPQRIVRSVSELVQERGPSSTANITHERVALRAFQRPSGTRFGILVHAVLAEVPLDAAHDRIADHARVQARMLGATSEETDAAIAAVGAALAHPVLVEARAALEVRREVPLQVRLPDGVLAEGVVDLAYRDASGWVVVDFKTDADPALRKDEYERQVALYSFALRRATGAAVRGVLLTV